MSSPSGTILELRRNYSEKKGLKNFLDWSARLTDDADIPLDRIAEQMGVLRPDAVDLAKTLQDIGVAEFVFGRRRQPSRIRWNYSPSKIAAAAQGKIDSFEESNVSFTTAMPTSANSAEMSVGGRPLTISEAKRLLAASLGVETSAIEITIRA
jgi:hypothetical protein